MFWQDSSTNVERVITSLHTLVYSDDPAATRAFFRDVLQWPFTSDSGNPDGLAADWLIFGTGRSELGVHPTSGVHDGHPYSSPRHHAISIMCDDLDATVAELRERGATFSGDPQQMGFGVGTMLQVPGADDMLLYEPRHATAYDL